MKARNRKDRWRVDYVCVRSRDSYFESDDQYEFRVIDTASGEIVKTFWRDEYANSDGSTNRGAKRVVISDDGKFADVENEDGTTERHRLPATGIRRKLADVKKSLGRYWNAARRARPRIPPP